MKNAYTSKEIKFLNKNYNIHGAAYCSKKLNRLVGSIWYKARALGLKVSTETKSKNTKSYHSKKLPKLFTEYKVNPLPFIKDFTKETAYILGLLWADGDTSDVKKHKVVIECVRKDIEKFYLIFAKTGQWYIYFRNRKNRQPLGSILTSNNPIFEFLTSHNYKSHNTKTATIIDIIPDKFKHYWYLGLIDGDGCWYINKKNGNYQFSICSCYEQDWSFVEQVLKLLNIKYSITRQERKTGNYSQIRVTKKNDVCKFGDYIYQNYSVDKIGLERKYDKYISIKQCL